MFDSNHAHITYRLRYFSAYTDWKSPISPTLNELQFTRWQYDKPVFVQTLFPHKSVKYRGNSNFSSSRSSILVPIESAYATIHRWKVHLVGYNSVLTTWVYFH